MPSMEGIIRAASEQPCLVCGMQGKPSLTALGVPDSCCMHGVLLSQNWLRDIFHMPDLSSCGSVKGCPSVPKLGFIQTPRGP